MRKHTIFALLAIMSTMISPVLAQPAKAADPGFNWNNIISDDQMRDYFSMSAARIQEFLSTQSGVLKSYSIRGKSAAQFIYDIGVQYQISPKVLLVTLQKEQSLISNASPSQRALDYALGYGCFEGTGCQAQYAGLDNQVEYAAWQYDRYLDNIAASGFSTAATVSQFGPNVTKQLVCDSGGSYDSGRGLCISGQTINVTPANAATAGLYTYTPHPGGNYLFWSLWRSYGFDQHRMYPDGTLLRANGKGTIYLIQDGVKRPFMNSTAFLATHSYSQVINVTTDALLQYENGEPIWIANDSFVSAPNHGVYLIIDNMKRPVKSRAALYNAGYNGEKINKFSWEVLNQFVDGPEVSAKDIYPGGTLVQSTKNGMIYYAKNGVKYPIPDGDIYHNQFEGQKPLKLSQAKIDELTWGPFVGFRDGTLIQSKNGGAVFLISNGYRLPIASWTAAKAYGFDKIMRNLVKTTDKAVAVHPLGQTLDVDTGYVSIASK